MKSTRKKSTPEVKPRILLKDQRRWDFTLVDNEVCDRELGAHALAVYILLARHANRSTGEVSVSQKELMRTLKMSYWTLPRAISTLVTEKLLSVESKAEQGEKNIYTLLDVPKKQEKKQRGGSSATDEGSSATDEGSSATDEGSSATDEGSSATDEGKTPVFDPKATQHKGVTRVRKKSTDDEMFRDEKLRCARSKARKVSSLNSSQGDTPCTPEEQLATEVVCWHKRYSRAHSNLDFPAERVILWIAVYIKALGLKVVRNIFEEEANGAKPFVDRFWKTLKAKSGKKGILQYAPV